MGLKELINSFKDIFNCNKENQKLQLEIEQIAQKILELQNQINIQKETIFNLENKNTQLLEKYNLLKDSRE